MTECATLFARTAACARCTPWAFPITAFVTTMSGRRMRISSYASSNELCTFTLPQHLRASIDSASVTCQSGSTSRSETPMDELPVTDASPVPGADAQTPENRTTTVTKALGERADSQPQGRFVAHAAIGRPLGFPAKMDASSGSALAKEGPTTGVDDDGQQPTELLIRARPGAPSEARRRGRHRASAAHGGPEGCDRGAPILLSRQKRRARAAATWADAGHGGPRRACHVRARVPQRAREALVRA